MLDWAARIDDLADKLAREYSIDDRQAIEVLLSAMVDCPRTPGCWLVLETNWYARLCTEAWFSFGELWEPTSLARLRARFPWRGTEAEMAQWFDHPFEARLFVEPDWERYPRFHRLTLAPYLLQRALRIRTRTGRTLEPLHALDQYTRDRYAGQLAAATNYVLEDRVQARPPDPPRFLEPPDFLYHTELLQRLAPWYTDWHTLVKAFALIGVRRAYLYGRTETNAEDYQLMARVLHDSVPPWIAKALSILLDHPSQVATLEKHMALEEQSRRSGHGAYRELIRLRRNGLIQWNGLHQHWIITPKHRPAIHALLAGQAFSGAVADSACSATASQKLS